MNKLCGVNGTPSEDELYGRLEATWPGVLAPREKKWTDTPGGADVAVKCSEVGI